MKNLIFALTLFAVACTSSSPLDRKFNRETFEKDRNDIIAASSNKDSMTMTMVWIGAGVTLGTTTMYEGKTYREVLEMYKKEQMDAGHGR